MWIFLNDAFFSIVQKECGRDELLVRARRKNDIETVFREHFPALKVISKPGTDYQFRARVPRSVVGDVLVRELTRITYSNFKDSVKDDQLHNAYARVWTAMASVQARRPFAREDAPDFLFGVENDSAQKSVEMKRKRGRPAKLNRGR